MGACVTHACIVPSDLDSFSRARGTVGGRRRRGQPGCGLGRSGPRPTRRSAARHRAAVAGVSAAPAARRWRHEFCPMAPSRPATIGAGTATETDVDCGGSCRQCADGGACAVDADCKSGVCSHGVVPARELQRRIDERHGDRRRLRRTGLSCLRGAPSLHRSEGLRDGLLSRSAVSGADLQRRHAAERRGRHPIAAAPIALPARVVVTAPSTRIASADVCSDSFCPARHLHRSASKRRRGRRKTAVAAAAPAVRRGKPASSPTIAAERRVRRAARARRRACTDSILNGTETDVDCGGRDCPDCRDEQSLSDRERLRRGFLLGRAVHDRGVRGRNTQRLGDGHRLWRRVLCSLRHRQDVRDQSGLA